MLQGKVTITNEIGIHARPASQFIRFLSGFTSDVRIRNGTKEGNARSITSLLGLAIRSGTEILVSVEGEDEAEAFPQIIDFLRKLED